MLREIQLGNLLAGVLDLVVRMGDVLTVEPESDLIHPDVETSRSEVVDESLLHILKRGIAGYLSPPAFEHPVVKGRLVDHARVEVVDLELRQVHLDGGV